MAEPRIEGRYVLALLDSAGKVSAVFESRAAEILADHGIEDPTAGDTYSATAFGDALSAMESDVGEMTVDQAGEEILRANPVIGDCDSFVDGFDLMQTQHIEVHENYSEDAVGQYHYERLGQQQYRVWTTGGYQYTESFLRGVIKGLVEVTESELATAQRASEDNGEVFAYQLSW